MSSTNASPQAGTPENAAISAAGTLAVDTARSTGALALRRVQLTGRPYRAMLEGYVCRRLALSPREKPADAQLLDAVIATADHRFAYVAFLTERCQRGREDADSLRRAAAEAPADPPANAGADASGDDAAAAPTAGEALYRRWLAGLHLEYGHKLAERMRAVLALLHAAEQAHAWVFGAGRIEHPVTGAALTPLPEQFQGLPLAVLQTLLLLEPPRQAAPAPLTDSDIGPDSPEPATPAAGDPNEVSPPPAEAYNPALLLTLQQLQGVLAVHRGGSGTSRFRIGLKDLGAALADDEHLAPLVRRAPALLAGATLDAVEAIAAGSEAAPDGSTAQPTKRPSRQPDWPLFEALAPLLDGLAATAGSDPVAARWRGLRGTAMRLLSTESDALEDDSRTDLNLPVLTLLAAWAAPPIPGRSEPSAEPSSADIERRNGFARWLSNRGIAHWNRGDLAAAIADYDAAIGLGEGIRDGLVAAGGEAAWSLPYRNDLARVLRNRGMAYYNKGDLAAAIADYDAAIGLGEGIRDGLIAAGGQAAWSLPYRNDLATVLQSRGVAHQANGDLAAAIADFDAAIGLCEGIRDKLIAAGGEAAWSLPYRNDLARVLQNRGNAHADNGDLAAAIADYDAAIGLGEDIRDRVVAVGGEAAWSLTYRNDLARVLQNRGMTHYNNGDLGEAIADYDAAIRLREDIRHRLVAVGGEAAWSLPYRNDLATVLQSRGVAHQANGDLAAAIADFDAAIGLCEGIRDKFIAAGGEAAWSLPYRNDLAGVLQNRGNAHADNGDLAAAIADYDAAIGLGEDIRDRVVAAGGEAAWSLPYRNDHAAVLQNRGIAHQDKGDLAAAIADYDAAIGLRECIRDKLIAAGGEAAWSLPYRNDYAAVLQNRGIAHQHNGDLAPAIADYDAAIGLREGIRDNLIAAGGEAAWSLRYRNNLAGVLSNRGNAYQAKGELAAAVADYDAAIGLREGIRDNLIATGGESAWPAPLRVDLARIHVNRACALGAVSGQGDLAAATEIAGALRAQGCGRDAKQVGQWCVGVQRHWQGGAGLTTLGRQNPRMFWLLHAVVAPIWLILLPIALLVRAVRWLRRRSG
jgi:tetratricopeptide (TPR) repeat protein